MYPFKWPHVYVPILPPSLENFLDAPVPYIMGLLRPTTDLELHKHGSVGILDIDHGKCVSDLYRIHQMVQGPLKQMDGIATKCYFANYH